LYKTRALSRFSISSSSSESETEENFEVEKVGMELKKDKVGLGASKEA
jgi:hypothetical protein